MIHWSIEISKVYNGYMCETYEDNEEMIGDKQLSGVFVVEESDCEQETMKRLLENVQNYFGVYTNKHNKKNCRVVLEDENGKILE